ncbi:MAG: hypothetical protein J0I40_02800, partial [Cellulomonas sp.]|nr:hypothetical protein [Cellulomonas sp.]
FDSGAQLTMLNRYGSHSPVLYEFRDWYIEECRRMGQETIGKIPCIYTRYKSGAKIEDAHRIVFRNREDLIRYFADPFDDSKPETSFPHWFEVYGKAETTPADAEPLRPAVTAQPSPAVQSIVPMSPLPGASPEPAPKLRRLIRSHAPEPAVKALHSMRAAWRRLSKVE